MPNLQGKYVYGDWCTGDIWALTYDGINEVINEHIMASDVNITSFGLDQDNELLICANSSIYKIFSDNPWIMGDLNQDGMINVQDIIITINIILGEPSNELELSLADLNSDGMIDILDVVLLVNLILQ